MKLPAYRLLSKEQDAINNLPLNGSYIVAGPPGTGKTVVALYRAAMLQKQSAKVQILTYSRVLTKYLNNSVQELKLEASVQTYHRWVNERHREMFHGLNAPKESGSDWNFDWDKILERVNDNPPEAGTLPYLIVDEGQDFPRKFFLLSRYIAKNTTVFADENQTLFETNSTIAEVKSAAGIRGETHFLRKNYRNTREIALLARRFYSGLSTGIPDLPERRGPKIHLKYHVLQGQSIDMIVRLHKNNPRLEIGVLLPTTALVRQYVKRIKAKVDDPAAVQYYYRDRSGGANDNLNFGKVGIRVLTYVSAKGLDFDAVFLPEVQEYRQDATSGSAKMQWYVLLSRAREQLHIFFRGEASPLIDMLAQYLKEDGTGDIYLGKQQQLAATG